jgi:uncharacterized protein YecT (DUF1311 family)
MLNSRLLLGLAAFGMCAAPAFAQSDDEIDARLSARYDRCLSIAETTVEMVKCNSDELVGRDAELNRAYRALMAQSNTTAAAGFRRSQRAWLSTRDSDCAAEAGQGTIAQINMAECVLRKTVERTLWLEARLG